MYIKRIIHEFNAENDENFQYRNLNTPCEIQFPPRSTKQQISFSYEKKEICFNLIRYYSPNELQEFKLMESSLIIKDYLNKLSVEFLFKITRHPLEKDLSIGVIPDIVDDYGKTCYGAVKKADNQYFFMIYTKKGSTSFEDDTIYVYGIWEVELSVEFKVKLFGSTNKPV